MFDLNSMPRRIIRGRTWQGYPEGEGNAPSDLGQGQTSGALNIRPAVVRPSAEGLWSRRNMPTPPVSVRPAPAPVGGPVNVLMGRFSNEAMRDPLKRRLTTTLRDIRTL